MHAVVQNRFDGRLWCALVTVVGAILLAGTPVAAETYVGGVYYTSAIWDLAGAPYILTSDVLFRPTSPNDHNLTLTIESGVEVQFNGYELQLGDRCGYASCEAKLAADGAIFTGGGRVYLYVGLGHDVRNCAFNSTVLWLGNWAWGTIDSCVMSSIRCLGRRFMDGHWRKCYGRECQWHRRNSKPIGG